MSWTYSGDPASSNLDELRFLVGDTDKTDQLLSDEEMTYILGTYADPGATYNNYQAAAAAASAIAAKFSRLVDKTVGSLSIQYGRRAQQFFDLADQLTDQATKGAGQRKMGAPVLGGGGETFLMGDDWK